MVLKTLKTGSEGNCYILKGDRSLILEAGADFVSVKKALDYNIRNIQGLLISHIHGDHIKYAWQFTRAGIRAYTNTETASIYKNGVESLEEKRWQKVGGFDVLPIYVPHVSACGDGSTMNCPNYAYIIREPELGKMLYATDFEYIPYTFKSAHLNHILIECNHIDRLIDKDAPNFEHVIRGHSSLEIVREIIKVNRTTELQTVTLCHLSSRNANEKEMLSVIREVAGAGVRVNIADPTNDVQLLDIPFME